MDVKQYLRQLKTIDKRLQALERERRDLEKAQTFLRSPQIACDRVHTSPSGDPPWLAYIIKWEKLTEDIGETWDTLINKRRVITDQINKLNDARYIEILSCRYAYFESFERIAVEMNYSFEYVLKLHGRALDAFREIWEGARCPVKVQ